jgi:hypothetical protein
LRSLTAAYVEVSLTPAWGPYPHAPTQASEKRQGTKSREWDGRQCSGLWAITLEGHGSDGRFWGEQMAGPIDGRVGACVWRAGKRVEPLLGGCLGVRWRNSGRAHNQWRRPDEADRTPASSRALRDTGTAFPPQRKFGRAGRVPPWRGWMQSKPGERRRPGCASCRSFQRAPRRQFVF